eukprot:4737711-Prymnesium_polylepis.1
MPSPEPEDPCSKEDARGLREPRRRGGGRQPSPSSHNPQPHRNPHPHHNSHPHRNSHPQARTATLAPILSTPPCRCCRAWRLRGSSTR